MPRPPAALPSSTNVPGSGTAPTFAVIVADLVSDRTIGLRSVKAMAV
jgi:hypothetical protein